jgi:hypothetical protein
MTREYPDNRIVDPTMPTSPTPATHDRAGLVIVRTQTTQLPGQTAQRQPGLLVR